MTIIHFRQKTLLVTKGRLGGCGAPRESLLVSPEVRSLRVRRSMPKRSKLKLKRVPRAAVTYDYLAKLESTNGDEPKTLKLSSIVVAPSLFQWRGVGDLEHRARYDEHVLEM